MTLRAGELRHKICIEEKVIRRDSFGAEVVTWSPLLYGWAKIEPLTGREYFASRQTQTSTSHKMTMRYQAGIKSYHRISWDDRVFDIDTILNEEERNVELIIYATEAI
jgi:SPP1 family predicted phage head-tail adaptor